MLYDAYNYIGTGLATTLHFMYPVFTVIISVVGFKEKLSKGKIAALALATLGIIIISGNGGDYSTKGIILAVGSACTYSFYLVGMDRSCLRKMDPYKVACYMGANNAIAMATVGLFTKDVHYEIGLKVFAYTFIIAILAGIFAFVFLQIGINILGATSAAILSMFEPIGCILAGWIFLNESMPIKKIISCFFVLLAVLILVLSDRKKKVQIKR